MPVSTSELRQNLASYLVEVGKGREIEVQVRGKVVARIVPVRDEGAAARERLDAMRGKVKVGDVISPTGEKWHAERA